MSNTQDDHEWRQFRDRFAIGQLVEGVVCQHAPFGIFVDIGSERFIGLVEVPAMVHDPRTRQPIWLEVGTRVQAVLLGFTDPHHQPRLSLRPSDVNRAGGRAKD